MTPMSEAARADLYTGLAELLGPERAETLMTHLPRYDPSEVATRSDVAALRSDFSGLETRLNRQFEQRFEHIDQRFARMDERFDRVDERFVRVEAQLDGLAGRLDRFFLTLVAGLFVIVAAMAGVLFATL